MRAEAARAARPVVAAPVARRFRGPHLWRVLALWGLVALAYSDSWRAGLVLDNALVIGNDLRTGQALPGPARFLLCAALSPKAVWRRQQ